MILKTKTLVGTYVHVLLTDPALDHEADGFVDAYRIAMDTGQLDKLPLKPGQQPLVWEFTQVGPDETAWLLDRAHHGQNGFALDAVALALVKVRGLKNEKGEDAKLVRRFSARRGGFKAVDDDQLAALFSDEDGRYITRWVTALGARVTRELLPRNG